MDSPALVRNNNYFLDLTSLGGVTEEPALSQGAMIKYIRAPQTVVLSLVDLTAKVHLQHFL